MGRISEHWDESVGSRVSGRTPALVHPRDPRHQAAYRAVLDYCSGGIQGIGPFEAEELVRLVERAFSESEERS